MKKLIVIAITALTLAFPIFSHAADEMKEGEMMKSEKMQMKEMNMMEQMNTKMDKMMQMMEQMNTKMDKMEKMQMKGEMMEKK